MSVVSSSFRSRVRASIERPVAGFFGRLGFSPNALTLIGFGIAFVAAWFAALEAWLLAGLLVAFGAIFDLFDGALARATNKTSKFGAFMDSTFDRAGEAVVYIGVARGLLSPTIVTVSDARLSIGYVGPDSDVGAVVAIVALAASFMVSYVRAKSESLGFSSGSGMANVGLAPREIRIVILSIGLIAAGLLAPVRRELRTGPTEWWYVLVGALALIAVLATITTIQRILFVYRQSKSSN